MSMVFLISLISLSALKSIHFKNSYSILISLKTMTIFNNTSADIKTKSADVLLKMVIVLSEMRIA